MTQSTKQRTGNHPVAEMTQHLQTHCSLVKTSRAAQLTAGSNKLAQAASDGATRPSIPLVLPSLLLQEGKCGPRNTAKPKAVAGGLYLVIPAQATCCARARWIWTPSPSCTKNVYLILRILEAKYLIDD